MKMLEAEGRGNLVTELTPVLETIEEKCNLHMALKNAETEYADIPLRGDGDQIVWYLKESRAYHKHRITGHVDPEVDGLDRSDEDGAIID